MAGLRVQGHRFRIPVADALLKVAEIREQRRTRGAQSEYGIFDYLLAAAHRRDEVSMVIQMVAVVWGRQGLFLLLRAHAVGVGTLRRILLVVVRQKLFL